ncbi:MAG: TatD family hydrolase [Bdellovibrionales bacterium]|nr:TatD family hydrolase [Bdellovibrionales bacterium]
MNLPWIDLHCHLNFLEMTPEEAIERAQAQGVERMITIGTCAADHPEVLNLVKKHYPTVHGTLGVHPHEAKEWGPATEKFLRTHLKDQGIVAVGEIGLDFYYDNSPREVQSEAFRAQLQLAEEFSLPIEIHTRDAEKETIEILQEFGGRIRGVVHCFSGSPWLAEEALKLGLNLSFSGIVTFKKAEELRQICLQTPLDRMHVETDAPFLAPVPHRGQKNEPAFVTHTAELVAQLKGISLQQLSEQTKKNALKVFQRLDW